MRHADKRRSDARAARRAARLLRSEDPFGDEDLALAERLLYGPDLGVGRLAAAALGRSGRREAIVPLVDTAFYADPDRPQEAAALRRDAVLAIGALDPHDDMAFGALVAASGDPHPAVARSAASVLDRCRGPWPRAMRAPGHAQRAAS